MSQEFPIRGTELSGVFSSTPSLGSVMFPHFHFKAFPKISKYNFLYVVTEWPMEEVCVVDIIFLSTYKGHNHDTP